MFPDAAIQYLIDHQEDPMSNEIKTRRLIVTLPDTSGEEVDTLIDALEYEVAERQGIDNATVTHALGEALPDGVRVVGNDRGVIVGIHKPERALPNVLTLYEARQLAGALLNIPGVAEAESPTTIDDVLGACGRCDTCGAAMETPTCPANPRHVVALTGTEAEEREACKRRHPSNGGA